MEKKHIDWATTVVCLLIGIGGAIGQAMILHNTLVHSYPFKMMNVPPAGLYAWIGNWGFFISLILAIVTTLISTRLRKWFVISVPVIVCPLIYWLFFEITFLSGPYPDDIMRESNFDGFTGLMARYEFAFQILALMFWGVVAASTSGYIIEKVSGLFIRRVTVQ